MQSTNVRVNQPTHEKLARLAESERTSMQSVAAKAVEAYGRQRIPAETNQAIAELKRDAKAWSDYQCELQAWDGTMTDPI